MMLLFTNKSIATTEEVLQGQKDTLHIKDFAKEANEYTKDVFSGIDVDDLINSAIQGKIDNKTIISKILNLFGKEVIQTIKIIGSIIIVIVIHSIFKSISENLENKSISQITYYVQYILIVTIIMSNFSDIIKLVKDTIQNLVGFSQSLIPILITLMMTTRKHIFCKYGTTYIIVSHNIHRKYDNHIFITINFNRNSTWNNFESIR